MPKIPVISAKDFIASLEKYGCVLVSVRGSHHKMFNPKSGCSAPVSVHQGKDVDKWIFISALRQLGIDLDDFLSAF